MICFEAFGVSLDLDGNNLQSAVWQSIIEYNNNNPNASSLHSRPGDYQTRLMFEVRK